MAYRDENELRQTREVIEAVEAIEERDRIRKQVEKLRDRAGHPWHRMTIDRVLKILDGESDGE